MTIWIQLGLRTLSALSVIVFREFIKALVAYWLTHPVYRKKPALHIKRWIDPIGLLAMVLFNVGWQRPAVYPVNRFRSREQGEMTVCMAGFLANASIFSVLLPTLLLMRPGGYLTLFIQYLILHSFALTIVNLLPIPPLDGAIMIKSLMKPWYLNLMRYASVLHMGLMVLVATRILSVLIESLLLLIAPYWLR